VNEAEATIRRASIEDAAEIAAVQVASWRGAYDGLLPQQMLDGLSVDAATNAWRHIVADNDGQTLIAVLHASHRVVGFANVGPSRDSDNDGTIGELRAIYLHPDHWNTGIGGRLHDAAVHALAESFSEAMLWVLDGNTRARHFYERHGWHSDGQTKPDNRGEVVLTEVRYWSP
jgi:GNAT superfamily N-acetyltransferase